MKSKLKSIVSLIAICGLFAFSTSRDLHTQAGEVWLGITWIISSSGGEGASGAAYAVGAIGVIDAAVWGFAVGSIATPVAGAVTGAVAGF